MWSKLRQRHCMDNMYSSPHDSLEAAKEACVALGTKCVGVYDSGCNGIGEYYACKVGDFGTSGVSCIYTRAEGWSPVRIQNPSAHKRVLQSCCYP